MLKSDQRWRDTRAGFVTMAALAMTLAACGEVTTVPASVPDGGDAAAMNTADGALEHGQDTAAPISVAQACSDLDTSLCGALNTCSTFVLQLAYGDVATCIARNNLSCTAAQNDPGVGRTTADMEGCAQALQSTSCPDLIAQKLPVACQDQPGAVADGLTCGAGPQCHSTFCNKQQGDCGTCAPREAAGVNCNSDAQCDFDLVCSGGMQCASPGEAGANCDDMNNPCRDNLYCKTGVCSAKAGAGGSCADTDKACDITKGVACNASTKICQNLAIAQTGDPCGVVSATPTLCAASGTCVGATLKTLFTGTCTAAAADGEACGAAAANGQSCLGPASCVNGICRLPGTSSCS